MIGRPITGLEVTDSGWAATDHWMGRYRPLDVPHILAGTAAANQSRATASTNHRARKRPGQKDNRQQIDRQQSR